MTETDLVETLRNTKRTFDVFAVRAQFIDQYYDSFKDALRRGVNVRVAVIDHSPKNKANVDAYLSAIRDTAGKPPEAAHYMANARHTQEVIKKLQREIEAVPGGQRGSLRLRALPGPFYNSIWISDYADSSSAVGHLSATFYGDESTNVCFRGSHFARVFIKNLAAQFEYIWQQSEEIPSH
jgi:hypothetical protein